MIQRNVATRTRWHGKQLTVARLYPLPARRRRPQLRDSRRQRSGGSHVSPAWVSASVNCLCGSSFLPFCSPSYPQHTNEPQSPWWGRMRRAQRQLGLLNARAALHAEAITRPEDPPWAEQSATSSFPIPLRSHLTPLLVTGRWRQRLWTPERQGTSSLRPQLAGRVRGGGG